MKRIKIKDARIRNNKIFQEDQGMFYRKTQGTKHLERKVTDMEKVEESGKTVTKAHNKNG